MSPAPLPLPSGVRASTWQVPFFPRGDSCPDLDCEGLVEVRALRRRKPTRFAFTLSDLEERTMLSLVSGVVADINQQVANGQADSSDPSSLTVLNGTLYFSANDGIHGTQLWKSDGTAAGTTMVTDFPQNGMLEGGPDTSSLVGFGGAIFFEVAIRLLPARCFDNLPERRHAGGSFGDLHTRFVRRRHDRPRRLRKLSLFSHDGIRRFGSRD